ncbi:hypothetical protein U9M48_017796 [Paspalum notatum var. saurae]|uniref:Uncharacterized protein n=1 Tax=Paspalum notatum var. saurae TaxID=547442 RepID=A0AAQ3WP65_PASNO
MPISSVISILFIFCSAPSGQHSIGTPAAMASSTEFHPQWVTKAPTAAWLSTSTCGAHDLRTRPRSLVRSKNPSGSSAPSSGLGSSVPAGADTTHRNRCPDFSRPAAISLICSSDSRPLLPQQRNTTLRPGCASSHARHSGLSAASLSSVAAALATNGPMGQHFARDALGVPERLQGPALQRVERVDQHAVGVRVALPVAHHGPARLVLRVLQQLPDEMGRRHGRDAKELEGRVPELLQARSPAGEQRRQLGVDGQDPGARGEERVHGDAQLPGHVDGVGAEHVDDERVQAVPGDGAEEALELVVVHAHELQHEEQRVLGAGEVGGWDRREDVEGDGRVGGRDVLHEAGAAGGGLDGRLDEHHSDVVAVAEEGLGEMRHGPDVPDADAGVQHNDVAITIIRANLGARCSSVLHKMLIKKGTKWLTRQQEKHTTRLDKITNIYTKSSWRFYFSSCDELLTKILNIGQEPEKCLLRRAAVLQRRLCFFLQLRRSCPQLPPLLALQHKPHLRLNLLSLDEARVVPLQLHPDAHLLGHQYFVHLLLCAQRPAQHRHPRRDGLQRGVPPAVGDERAHGWVVEHVHLRCPGFEHEAMVLGPLQEPLRQQRVEVWLGALLEVPVDVVGAGRRAHDPQEPLPRLLYAGGDLLDLRLRQQALAPPAEEHDAALRLRVEPREALGPLCCCLFVRPADLGDQRPDGVNGRQHFARDAPGVPERLQGLALQRVERVHQNAVGVRVALPDLHHVTADLIVPALQHLPHEMGRRHGRHPKKLEGRIPELLQARLPAGNQRRQLGEDGQSPRARGEERVDRDAQLPGHVDDLGAEHVDDDGVQALPGDGAEEALELLVVLAHELHHLEERVLGGGGEVGWWDRREDVEGDGGVGGGDALDEAGAGVGGLDRRLDEHHGDVVAVAEEDLGQMRHGPDVADAAAGVQHNGLLHGSVVHVSGASWSTFLDARIEGKGILASVFGSELLCAFPRLFFVAARCLPGEADEWDVIWEGEAVGTAREDGSYEASCLRLDLAIVWKYVWCRLCLLTCTAKKISRCVESPL